jgi:hypothetical protein
MDNVPATVSTTIALQPDAGGPIHKVTKVVGYKEGGLALLAPYHKARSGVLTKTLVDYRQGGASRHSLEQAESFSAGDRVKLSYHPDGFVQFSGERPGRIVSGRDPRSGEPRGLGVMANPMDAPVMTGPAFGITFWGLDDFEVQSGRPRGDSLVFGPEDFVYDYCDEEHWGSYGISFFIFTVYFQPYVRRVERTRFEMPIWHNQYHGGEGRAFILKVIRLGQQPWFLGAVCFRRRSVGFDAASGWNIGSPGALTHGPIKPVLHAHFPADGWPEPDLTLDFNPQQDATADLRLPLFARDYDALMARAEARLVHDADRELPEGALVREGIRLLAEVVERTVLTREDLDEPAGHLRIAMSVLAILTLRGGRAFLLLVEPGYVPEAGVVLNRMTSAVELARLIDEDAEDAEIAKQFIDGAGLDELEPETWSNIAQAIGANITQLPRLGLIQTPLGPRPGFGLAGTRDSERAKEATVDAAAVLLSMTVLCGKVLLGDTVPELLGQRVVSLREKVAHDMQGSASASEDRAEEASDETTPPS